MAHARTDHLRPLLLRRLHALGLAAACVPLIWVSSATAQFQYTDAGSPSTNWCTPGNWQPMQVPSGNATVSIGPGQPIDMFLCGNDPYSIGAIDAQRPVRFWPTMSFLGGGTLLNPDLAMSTAGTSVISGALTVSGTTSQWTSGWITGGTVLNTGTMRTVQGGGVGHVSRILGATSRLHNQGMLEVQALVQLRDGGMLLNDSTLTFIASSSGTSDIGYTLVINPTGIVRNNGTIVAGSGVHGAIRTDYDGSGGVRALGGTIEFGSGAHLFDQTPFDILSGGSVIIGGETLDEATFRNASASGVGQLKLDGSVTSIESLATNFDPTLGNGLWFTNLNFPIRLGTVASDGLVSWSQGSLESLSGNPPTLDGPDNLFIGSQGLWRIGTPVEGSGPGFLDGVKVIVRGDANQQADLRLRNGAIVIVEENADWILPAGRGIRGEVPASHFVVRGDLIVIPNTNPAASILQAVVTIEGNGRLLLGDTRLEVNNLIGTANPFQMSGDSVLDISTLGEFRLQNSFIATGGSPIWVGSGKFTTNGPFGPGIARVIVNDGATLTNQLSGSGPDDGFFLGHELRSGDDDSELIGFSPSFLNAGKMVWLNGEVSIRNDLDEGFVNLSDLFIRTGANHRVFDCTMVNQAFTFHEAGALVLAQRGFFHNNGLYSMTGGSITRENGATLGVFNNAAMGQISKTQATAASISAPLNNSGRVQVLEGTLTISGAIAQVVGPASSATLTGGLWDVGASGSLATPAVTIRTLGAGAAVNLSGAWPQFQPEVVLGNLTLAGGRTFAGGLRTEGMGIVAVSGATAFGGPIVLNGAGFDINGGLSAPSLTVNQGRLAVTGILALGGTLTLEDGLVISRGQIEWDSGVASVEASGGRIEGTGEFGDPADTPVAFDCTGCSIAPGNSPGILTIHGSLTLGGQSLIEIEIAGRDGAGSAQGHDQVAATESTALAGTLRLSLLNDFAPVQGDSFLIVASPEITGSFATILAPAGLALNLRARTAITAEGLEVRFTAPADFNADGETNPDDLADYINCYFAPLGACPAADFNADGDTNADDLSDYINVYFAL